MLRFEMSNHVKEDRMERLAAIATNIGFGDTIVMSAMSTREGYTTRMNLSDTGVMFITNASGKRLVTAYVPHLDEVCVLEKLAGSKLTTKMWAKIHKNQKIRIAINDSLT